MKLILYIHFFFVNFLLRVTKRNMLQRYTCLIIIFPQKKRILKGISIL
ncbi:hypothetical protein FM106_15265 [Brachybacterium faecium]|nr:hypothetical protein FM106_15265 [Brachybacterium faecium]